MITEPYHRFAYGEIVDGAWIVDVPVGRDFAIEVWGALSGAVARGLNLELRPPIREADLDIDIETHPITLDLKNVLLRQGNWSATEVDGVFQAPVGVLAVHRFSRELPPEAWPVIDWVVNEPGDR